MGKKVKDKRRAKLKVARREEKERENAEILFRCLGCGIEEMIPREVVEEFDFIDNGDIDIPPRFKCEKCPEEMEPVLYESVHGITYEWKDKS